MLLHYSSKLIYYLYDNYKYYYKIKFRTTGASLIYLKLLSFDLQFYIVSILKMQLIF